MRDVLPPTTQLRAGTYQLDYALGRGGFGVTYRGHHTLLEQLVAIKEFFPQSCAVRNPTTGGFTIPRNQGDVYQRGKQRFLKEGKILARLRHPHVVGVTDLFEENDTAYLVMELVSGRSLRTELESQPGRKLSPERVKEITGQLVEALAAVHQEGIFHLDVKPDNVLLAPEGKSVLVDFGSAKQAVGTRVGSSSTRTFTQEYAAPEVIGGGEVGVESDIFELGMMVYEMLVGELPPNALLRLTQIDWKPEGLASPWQELLVAALAYQKEDRPKDVKEWWRMVGGSKKSTTQPVNPSATSASKSAANFETVTVNARGEVIKREPRQAEVFAEDLGDGVKLEMVSIPGGSFLMGSPESEKERLKYESPQHRVNVPPFFLGKYPVTQKQYEAVMGNNPSRFKGVNRPVENVSWNDATDFCQRLSHSTGKIYRLPSEAEWEYACRAGTTTPFYFGPTITADLANYNGDYTYGSAPKGVYREETTDVGSFPPNAFGLYDMHGNVWEWCQDVWHENYNGAPTNGSAWESGGDSSYRMLRGGSWLYYPVDCRSAARSGTLRTFASTTTAFV
jgi:formylglycine-generating enzyme required for sulfatase activity/predicted Ser/Thr protein kinase